MHLATFLLRSDFSSTYFNTNKLHNQKFHKYDKPEVHEEEHTLMKEAQS